MATIDAVEVGSFRVPLATVLTDSTHGVMAEFELLTVQVRDADGAEGLGYTYAVNSGAEAFRVLIEGYLVDVLVGREAEEIESRWQDMWWRVHYAGRGGHATSAISAVDIALWDLKARRLNAPLWQLLGGYDPRVPVYAGGVDLELPIGDLLAQADRFREAGFGAIKMKVGRPRLREDVERATAMREHLGEDFPLMVDANMRWTADEAVRAARELRDLQVHWVEEPTIPEDVEGHRRVVAEGGVPVAAGENLHTLHEFERVISAGAVTFPEPDVSNCGGVTVFRKVAALAEARNLPVTSHGVHDLTLPVLASVPNRTYMEAHGFSLDDYLEEPMTIVDGHATASDQPGHGLRLNWRRLEPHRVH